MNITQHRFIAAYLRDLIDHWNDKEYLKNKLIHEGKSPLQNAIYASIAKGDQYKPEDYLYYFEQYSAWQIRFKYSMSSDRFYAYYCSPSAFFKLVSLLLAFNRTGCYAHVTNLVFEEYGIAGRTYSVAVYKNVLNDSFYAVDYFENLLPIGIGSQKYRTLENLLRDVLTTRGRPQNFNEALKEITSVL